MTAVDVEEVVANEGRTGAIQPAVGPDGVWIAYIARTHGSGGQPTGSTLRVIRRDKSTVVDLDSGTSAGERPQFPNFFDAGEILYTKATSEIPGSLWRASGPWTGSPSIQKWLGQGGLSHPGGRFSWKDVNTRLSSIGDPWPVSGLMLSRNPEIVTFGGNFNRGEQRPVVSDRNGNQLEPFELGANEDGHAIMECHHPAWSVTGDRILCTAHEPVSNSEHSTRTARLLYDYEYSLGSRSWKRVSAGPLIKIPEDYDVSDDVQAFSGIDYSMVTHKYAEWCGSNRFVVMTVFLSSDANVLASRVVVGDATTQKLHDVTQAVQDRFFVRDADIRAIYSTCSMARWRP